MNQTNRDHSLRFRFILWLPLPAVSADSVKSVLSEKTEFSLRPESSVQFAKSHRRYFR